ncbi:MAG TPA: hypothetical protein VKU60_00490 [Chloroflexota bacterium]|nr:hypothetical protein [Chloroflexota bacterium]
MCRSMLRSLLAACVGASFTLFGSAGAFAAPGPPATIPSCQYTSDNTHALPFCSTGQTTGISLPTNSTASYAFNYPGDNSNITFTASLDPIDPSNATAAGFNVFDTNSKAVPPSPVEVATVASDGISNDPHSMQFNYSSGTPGPVTLQLFNYTSNTVTFSLNDSGLQLNTGSGSVTTPVTLQLGSAPPAASGSSPAPPTPGQPATTPKSASGAPATIQSCQYTSDNTHPLPFCSTGQTTAVTVPSNGSVTYQFNYPGDNSNITVTAMISPVDPSSATAVGFNVFDTATKATPPVPVEVATIASNQISGDPHSMQFNYSSGITGPVTLQLFNYESTAATFNISDSGLVLNTGSGGVTSPVTLQLS